MIAGDGFFDGFGNSIAAALYAIGFFLPLMIVPALVCGGGMLVISEEFANEDDDSKTVKRARAFGYLLMFSIFGLAVAYFMAQGLTESDGNRFSNPTLDPFAAALISLITGGLAFAAKFTPIAPKALPLGILVFLLNALIGYETFVSIAHSSL